MGFSVFPSSSSNHCILLCSSGMLIFTAAWQAMLAAMRRRRTSMLSACAASSSTCSSSARASSSSRPSRSDRRSLDRQRARTERLRFEAVAVQFVGHVGEVRHLGRKKVDQERHQQALALHALHLPLAQHLLKQDALVRHVLVDDPKALFIDGEDEGVLHLAKGSQAAQTCEVGGVFNALGCGCLIGGASRQMRGSVCIRQCGS